MSHALSIADRLHEGAQELARAWNVYAEVASHWDGHARGCASRDWWIQGLTGSSDCNCGYAQVERAIRDLTTIVNTRDSAQGV